MGRGIAYNNVWKVWWRLIVIQTGSQYRAPPGSVGRRFVKFLEEEFCVAREQRWNVERPMVFMVVILNTTPGARKAHDILRSITRHLDMS